MEATIKKFQQRFKKAREEMERWDALQSRFVSQFMNASAIIERLPVLQDSKNFGLLNSVPGIQDAVLMKQMESLQKIFNSMRETLGEFHGITLNLGKIRRDAKGLTGQMTSKQLQQQTGIKPTLSYCLDGLSTLHEIHHSEYNLKLSMFQALSVLALKFNANDLRAVQQLLVDQPNIIEEEVDSVFSTIFAGEMP